MDAEQHQSDFVSRQVEPGPLSHLVDQRIKQMQALARSAGVEVSWLQTILTRLHHGGEQRWQLGSLEARVQRAIDELWLPPVAMLVGWVRYLALTEEEIQALREGVREGMVLALLDLRAGPMRKELLRQARVEGWMVREMRRAVLKAPEAAKFRHLPGACFLE